MCCFSVGTPVGLIARLFGQRVHVSKTNLFARMVAPGVQALAYSMDLDAANEVAMILPLPVALGSGDDALTFVDLSKVPQMFEDLNFLFEVMQTRASKGGFPLRLGLPTLAVHRVGAFIASYVPTRVDFDRLDARFHLPKALFDAVPHYEDYGFAVFQLVPGKVSVHPMAMTFATRAPTELFFPTVHLHDGRFHKAAKFDHALYYQTPRCPVSAHPDPIASFDGDTMGWMLPRNSYEGLVATTETMIRRRLRGKLPNCDTWVAA